MLEHASRPRAGTNPRSRTSKGRQLPSKRGAWSPHPQKQKKAHREQPENRPQSNGGEGKEEHGSCWLGLPTLLQPMSPPHLPRFPLQARKHSVLPLLPRDPRVATHCLQRSWRVPRSGPAGPVPHFTRATSVPAALIRAQKLLLPAIRHRGWAKLDEITAPALRAILYLGRPEKSGRGSQAVRGPPVLPPFISCRQ